MEEYLHNYEKYGQTIVFALNKVHAIALNKLFNEKGKAYGIRSEFIISEVQDMITGITISNADERTSKSKHTAMEKSRYSSTSISSQREQTCQRPIR